MARAGELSRRILNQVAAANESFERATARLIRLAELAYGRRDYAALEATGEALAAIPFQPAQRAGTYYRAVLHTRAGELDRAAELLGDLRAPRALLTLGTVEEYRGNFAEAARLHVEAMRAGRGLDLFTVAGARMQLATIRAVEGDHAGALHDLQSAGPLVRLAAQAQPSLYPIWHNAVAVELGELGRVEEARPVIAVALASPIADRYPEFEQTAAELRQVEPGRVAVVVIEPQREGKPRRVSFTAPAVTRHPSLISRQWPVGSGRRSPFIIRHHQARAPGASPRAPPSFVNGK
jgi:tetratricopeptide (TPR) repeat protein